MGGLSDGVMVTQRPLEALFMVRIHTGQPLLVSINYSKKKSIVLPLQFLFYLLGIVHSIIVQLIKCIPPGKN